MYIYFGNYSVILVSLLFTMLFFFSSLKKWSCWSVLSLKGKHPKSYDSKWCQIINNHTPSSQKLIQRKIHSLVILALTTKNNNRYHLNITCYILKYHLLYRYKYFTDRNCFRKEDCSCLLASTRSPNTMPRQWVKKKKRQR